MADPRKATIYDDIDRMPLPFAYDGTIVFDRTKAGGATQVNLAVALTGAKTVGLGADGTRIEGQLENVEPDGYCTVNTRGGMTFAAAAPIANGAKIVNAGAGLVRAVNTAVPAEVNAARGVVVDGTVAGAIKVTLV